jgi:hypothetical protein
VNPQQRLTLRALGLASVAAGLIVLGLLCWEGYALTLGASATISEVIWILWAAQPGPIALVFATLTFWAGVLCGHFVWQSAKVYAEIRHVRDGSCCADQPCAPKVRDELNTPSRPTCCNAPSWAGHVPHPGN